MPGHKRKAMESSCRCFTAHETEAKCEQQAFEDECSALAKKHRAITAKVIPFSETIEVFAGKEEPKEIFNVHKDLLALHSGYFSNLFSEKGPPGVERKVAITAKPSLFADFVAWIYFGEFLEVENNDLEGGTAVDELWELGRFFKAPAFQNFCMNDCRSYCKASETKASDPWPFIGGIRLMYSLTPRGSLLRLLAVHSLSYKNPLQENEKGSRVWKEWRSLLTGQISREPWVKDLQDDFALEAGRDWNGIPPWSDQRRDDYMEKEIALENCWDTQILAARTRAEVKRAALAKTDVRSIIEWAHLKRPKSKK